MYWIQLVLGVLMTVVACTFGEIEVCSMPLVFLIGCSLSIQQQESETTTRKPDRSTLRIPTTTAMHGLSVPAEWPGQGPVIRTGPAPPKKSAPAHVAVKWLRHIHLPA